MVESGTTAPPPASPPAAPPQRRAPLRWYFLGALLLLLTGAVGGSWAIDRLREWRGAATPGTLEVGRDAGGASTPDATEPAAAAASPPTSPPADLAGRVRLLEARLAELSVATGSTAGNAARAEGLAFSQNSATRCTDSGLPRAARLTGASHWGRSKASCGCASAMPSPMRCAR